MAKRHDATGRSKKPDRYVIIFHRMLDCPAWRALSPASRSVYLQIARLYNGSNNGRIAYGVRRAAEECIVHKDTASRAFHELEAKGFIERTRSASFGCKRTTAEWRLTWVNCDLTGAPDSRLCLQWRSDGVFDTAPPPVKKGNGAAQYGASEGTP
jgi:hypothetical protein